MRIEEKYRKDIQELNQANIELDKIYMEYHSFVDNFVEHMNILGGRFPYLSKNEYNFRINELFSQMRDAYKTMDTLYAEIIQNKKQLNNISLYLRAFIDLFEDWQDIKELKNEIKGKMKEYEQDAPFIKKLAEITRDLEKQEQERENYSGEEFA